MTAAIQWRGSVEALADDLRTMVPPGEWPKFLALFMPRTEPRPMPAYLTSLPRGPGARDWHKDPPRTRLISKLSERAHKALTALSLAEPRDFARLTWLDMLKVDGCGTKTRAELLRWAGEYGAHLIERLPKREREAILAQRKPKPTSENVLRAMAASYAHAWINESEDEDWEGYLYAVREALHEYLLRGDPGYMPQDVAADYQARLNGDIPPDAPPFASRPNSGNGGER